jgi:hypothetical protein
MVAAATPELVVCKRQTLQTKFRLLRTRLQVVIVRKLREAASSLKWQSECTNWIIWFDNFITTAIS